jgi:hypothetical protein
MQEQYWMVNCTQISCKWLAIVLQLNCCFLLSDWRCCACPSWWAPSHTVPTNITRVATRGSRCHMHAHSSGSGPNHESGHCRAIHSTSWLEPLPQLCPHCRVPYRPIHHQGEHPLNIMGCMWKHRLPWASLVPCCAKRHMACSFHLNCAFSLSLPDELACDLSRLVNSPLWSITVSNVWQFSSYLTVNTLRFRPS